MASSSALRELQRELEAKANDLSKIQKGKSYFKEPPSEEEVHYTARRERARPQGLLLSRLRFLYFLFGYRENEFS
ncbi:hypothetical protein C1H46_026330 [Malus baccata]|uniref:Uncharacterized protein n=1 Tax=Malus baccata TaxID=106549 RepID=A0A540LNR5_MALBA|nr:hypothetical protein C1H46_026330 [Malus baccata]